MLGILSSNVFCFCSSRFPLLLLMFFRLTELLLEWSNDNSELSGDDIWPSLATTWFTVEFVRVVSMPFSPFPPPFSPPTVVATTVELFGVLVEFSGTITVISCCWSLIFVAFSRPYLWHFGWWALILLGESVRISGAGSKPSLFCFFWYLYRTLARKWLDYYTEIEMPQEIDFLQQSFN